MYLLFLLKIVINHNFFIIFYNITNVSCALLTITSLYIHETIGRTQDNIRLQISINIFISMLVNFRSL